MANQNVSSLFVEKEEDTTSVFLLEDIIKEYNHKIVTQGPSVPKKKVPLSLRPPKGAATIRGMTMDELDAMLRNQLAGNDADLLKKLLREQAEPKGLVANVPNIAQGATLIEVTKELGLLGKVYYKTEGGKTYVILKGAAKNRTILKGTRYLNTNPQIVQFGLAKVSASTLFKSGLKTSLWIYGGIKVLDATKMLLEDGKLQPSFFSEVGTDIPKIAITTLVGTATAVTVAAVGVPVAVGAGIVLVVSVFAGIGIELLDRKNGITEKFNHAADQMYHNLKNHLGSNSKSQKKYNDWDFQGGRVFERYFVHNSGVRQKGNYFVYTA